MILKEAKKKSKALDVMLRIGKNGVSEGMLNEIKMQLKKKRLLKIKILRSVEGKDDAIEKIKEATGCIVVDKIGNTTTIWNGK